MNNNHPPTLLKETKNFEDSISLTVSLFSNKINTELTQIVIDRSRVIQNSIKRSKNQTSEDDYMEYIFMALKACYDIEVGITISDNKDPQEKRFADIVRYELKNLKKRICLEMEQPSFITVSK